MNEKPLILITMISPDDIDYLYKSELKFSSPLHIILATIKVSKVHLIYNSEESNPSLKQYISHTKLNNFAIKLCKKAKIDFTPDIFSFHSVAIKDIQDYEYVFNSLSDIFDLIKEEDYRSRDFDSPQYLINLSCPIVLHSVFLFLAKTYHAQTVYVNSDGTLTLFKNYF
jgi:hypothetical protein